MAWCCLRARSCRDGLLAGLLAVAGGVGAARAQSDRCADAGVLPMGVLTIPMAGMTADGVDQCRSGVPDVWYTFTAPRDGVLYLDGCGATSLATYSVHTGCPGTPANMIACNAHDSYHCGYRPHLEITVAAGAEYRVRVGSLYPTERLTTWFGDLKPAGGTGPDIVSGDIPESRRYAASGEWTALAFGSTACNIGTAPASWTNAGSSNEHPVISSGLYRVEGGVLEQLGYSWLKHGWASGTETFCDYCPSEGVLGVLLPGCSDTYDVPQNGTQQILGRRSEVNPTTGIFPYPPVANPAITDSTSRRLRVLRAAIDPGQHASAVYLAELQYIGADDALAGNALNNVSYRQARFSSATAPPTLTAPVARTRCAIQGWADTDPEVGVVPVDFTDNGYPCRVWVASRVSEVSPGRWRYVYAVFNLNADRAVAGLILPRRAGAELGGAEQRFAPSDPGEVYSNTPWVYAAGSGEAGWRCAETYGENPAGNAIRWGTTHTFILESSAGPQNGRVRLPLFRPGLSGEPAELSVVLPVPSRGSCLADFNGDGFVDFFDYDDFVGCYEAGLDASDVNGDGFLDFFDYDEFVLWIESGC